MKTLTQVNFPFLQYLINIKGPLQTRRGFLLANQNEAIRHQRNLLDHFQHSIGQTFHNLSRKEVVSVPNGQKPLNFVSSSPRDGATDVSPNLRTIVLNFDKNVVDDSVWSNNRTQIKLFRNSTRVGIRVLRSSVFANRQKIYVRPINRLRSFSDYKVVILPNLTAKNGEKLGETVTIHFHTGSRFVEE